MGGGGGSPSSPEASVLTSAGDVPLASCYLLPCLHLLRAKMLQCGSKWASSVPFLINSIVLSWSLDLADEGLNELAVSDKVEERAMARQPSV